jgi:hypothetical protein
VKVRRHANAECFANCAPPHRDGCGLVLLGSLARLGRLSPSFDPNDTAVLDA